MKKAKLICIGGIPGVGKSTAGSLLEEKYSKQGVDTVVVCPDKTRLEVLGKSGGVITNDDLSREVTLATIDKMASNTLIYLKEGKTVIVPSAFILESMRERFESMAKENKAIFKGIWLEAEYDIIKDRAEKRFKDTFNRHASAVVPDKNVKPEGYMKWYKIDASGTPKDICEKIYLFSEKDGNVEPKLKLKP